MKTKPSHRAQLPAGFSHELRALNGRFAKRPVTLGEILAATKGRGFDLLLILIALPFLTPIPLPGFSIPFGLVVGLIGATRALGLPPWLPQRLLNRKMPAGLLSGLLPAASRIVRGLEFFLRPRLLFVDDHQIFRRFGGVLIALSGIYLIAPLPVPFSNSLPAWTVLFLAAGTLARDGLFFFAGCLAFAVTTAFFALLAFGGMQAVDNFRQFLTGG